MADGDFRHLMDRARQDAQNRSKAESEQKQQALARAAEHTQQTRGNVREFIATMLTHQIPAMPVFAKDKRVLWSRDLAYRDTGLSVWPMAYEIWDGMPSRDWHWAVTADGQVLQVQLGRGTPPANLTTPRRFPDKRFALVGWGFEALHFETCGLSSVLANRKMMAEYAAILIDTVGLGPDGAASGGWPGMFY